VIGAKVPCSLCSPLVDDHQPKQHDRETDERSGDRTYHLELQ
jgi:hypothetical protein